MRPQVVAHRGASYENAEHTLGAYIKALEAGAEGLECDVRLTADGHLVCVHDRDLRRTASTRGVVSTMDLADLSQLDFASWKNPWADLDDEREEPDTGLNGVLTLHDLLTTIRDFDRRVEIAIETKHPTRYGGLVERRLVETLAEFGWDTAGSPARIMSFSWVALQRAQRLAPDLDYVLLLEKARSWPALKAVAEPGWILGPGVSEFMDHPKFAKRLRASGRRIHVWTVNTDEQLQACLDIGAEAVITDRPAYMLAKLGG